MFFDQRQFPLENPMRYVKIEEQYMDKDKNKRIKIIDLIKDLK